MRPVLTVFLTLTGLSVTGGMASAQEDPPTEQDPPAEQAEEATPPVAPVEAQLVFEREVFLYPQFSRRNPFVPLVASRGGPRFEQIRLRMIIHASDPRESVALLGLGEATDPTQGANGGQGSRTKRIRVGQTWGNVTVLEIRQEEMLVQVEEFGLTEQRIIRLPAPVKSAGARGGS